MVIDLIVSWLGMLIHVHMEMALLRSYARTKHRGYQCLMITVRVLTGAKFTDVKPDSW